VPCCDLNCRAGAIIFQWVINYYLLPD